MYRIYTEDKNFSKITAIVARHFTGFTMFQGIGYWKGYLEKSVVIEIISDDTKDSVEGIVKKVCREIKDLNQQESVLMVYIPEGSILI